jgi:hypothetical protein
MILAEGYSRYGISVETSPSKQLVGQKAPYSVWLDVTAKGAACNVLGTK